MSEYTEYHYRNSGPTHANSYLWPVLQKMLARRFPTPAVGLRAFDLGCGSGATSNLLRELGFDVVGIDPSESGIALARQSYPQTHFDVASAYDDLSLRYGQFDVVVSLEVVEHVYDPRTFASRVFNLLKPGAPCIISTPYHGYLKNLALAVTGKMDQHFTALWDGGHIKFWSIDTLGQLLTEAGLQEVQFERVGRVPSLAKSMVACAVRPANK